MCFGANPSGALGRGNVAGYGSNPGDMLALGPILFDNAKIPITAPECAAILISLKESTGKLTGFDSFKYFYMFSVTENIDTFKLLEIAVSPDKSLVLINGLEKSSIFVLSSLHINKFEIDVYLNDKYVTKRYSIFIRRFSSTKIEVGMNFSCLLTSSRVTCWGDNLSGTLGRDNNVNIGTNPTDMSNLTFISFSPTLNTIPILELSVGTSHFCVLFGTLKIVCVGNNSYGELGAEVAVPTVLGDTPGETTSLAPLNFAVSIATQNIIQLALGDSTTCVLFSNGRVSCLGYGGYGVIGKDNLQSVGEIGTISTLTYISFSDTIPAVQIDVYNCACAVFSNSRVRCWGQNSEQQLGIGNIILKGIDSGGNSITETAFITFSPLINHIPIKAVSVGAYIYIYKYI